MTNPHFDPNRNPTMRYVKRELEALHKPRLEAFKIGGKTWGVPAGTLCIEYAPQAMGGPSFCRLLILP
jgi:hypothetical protein